MNGLTAEQQDKLDRNGLTWLQLEIMHELLRRHGPVSPTVLGNHFRRQGCTSFSKLTSGSAWASPKLCLLESYGLVSATAKRHYYLSVAGLQLARKWWPGDEAPPTTD